MITIQAPDERPTTKEESQYTTNTRYEGKAITHNESSREKSGDGYP